MRLDATAIGWAGSPGLFPTQEVPLRKFVVLVVALLAGISLTRPSQGSAQSVFVGIGPTFPSGEYKDFGDEDGARTGWMTGAGVLFPMGENGLAGFVAGVYGSNSHEYEGDKTNLLGGFAGIEYVFAEPGEAGPFVLAELGILSHSGVSEDFPEHDHRRSGFAFGGGAGYVFPMGRLSGRVLGRYIHGLLSDDHTGEGDTTLFGLMAGVSVPIGG